MSAQEENIVTEFVNRFGSRIALVIGPIAQSRQAWVERRVNGHWSHRLWGVSAEGADKTLEEWANWERSHGGTETTDEWERSHCPMCGASKPTEDDPA